MVSCFAWCSWGESTVDTRIPSGVFSENSLRKLAKRTQMQRYDLRCKRKLTDFYKYVGPIASGAYGSVAKWRLIPVGDSLSGDNFVAVKHIKWGSVNRKGNTSCCPVFPRGLPDGQDKDVEAIRREMQALIQLDNRYMVRFHEWFEHPRSGIYLVMEFCSGPTLRTLLDKTCDAPETERHEEWEPRLRNCFRQVCYAMRYVHKKNIVHRDLKPDNIVLKNDNMRACIKIIDFGLATLMDLREAEKTEALWATGTMEFMPPSRFTTQGGSVTGKTDVWALGVIFAYIVTAISFGECHHPMLLRGVAFEYHRVKTIYECQAPWNRELFIGQDKRAFELADGIFVYCGQTRLSMDDVLANRWVRDCGKFPVQLGSAMSRGWSTVFQNLESFARLTKLQQMIATRVTRHVRDSQVTELRRIFDYLDASGMGVLTRDEVFGVLEREDHGIPEEVIRSLQEHIVTNELDEIEEPAWLAAAAGTCILQDPQAVQRAFFSLDSSHTGKIDPDDLAIVLGHDVHRVKRDLIAERGTDASISFSEFRSMVRMLAHKRVIVKQEYAKLAEIDHDLLAPAWRTIEELLGEKLHSKKMEAFFEGHTEESKIMELWYYFHPALMDASARDCIPPFVQDMVRDLFNHLVSQSGAHSVDFGEWLVAQCVAHANEVYEKVFLSLNPCSITGLAWSDLVNAIGEAEADRVSQNRVPIAGQEGTVGPIKLAEFKRLNIAGTLAKQRVTVLAIPSFASA